MSDISSLRAELSQLQAKNRELRGHITELSMGVNNARRSVDDFHNKVNQTLGESNNRIN